MKFSDSCKCNRHLHKAVEGCAGGADEVVYKGDHLDKRNMQARNVIIQIQYWQISLKRLSNINA